VKKVEVQQAYTREGPSSSFLNLKSPFRDVDARASLDDLIRKIEYYDSLRIKLEMQGGEIQDLERIVHVLRSPVLVPGRFGINEVVLEDQQSLRIALMELGNFDLHLQVRRLESFMPVYYLCRIHRDFWAEYALVVEDLYCSPGYPSVDERFVRLMIGAHETYHIRLSPFRHGAAKMLMKDSTIAEGMVDELLLKLGRFVFQAAWHEDQRPAFLAATDFGLKDFKEAVELLYICLSGELCELRSELNPPFLQFFVDVYPHQALHAFLQRLINLEGGALTEIPQKALKLYSRLSLHFSKFLKTEVSWGNRNVTIPLYKLLFGNFSRLDTVWPHLHKKDLFRKATRALETESQNLIAELLK